MTPTIDDRVTQALEMMARGFNCAQAVAVACADLTPLSEEDLYRAAAGFGLGMGGMSETCGAISGGVVALGSAASASLGDTSGKSAAHEGARKLVARFREENGATTCWDLKGMDGGPALRDCKGCVEDALRITYELLTTAPTQEE